MTTQATIEGIDVLNEENKYREELNRWLTYWTKVNDDAEKQIKDLRTKLAKLGD